MKIIKVPNTIKIAEKLRCNAHLNKHIHFNASKRNRNYHLWVGIPVILSTVVLSFLLSSPEEASTFIPDRMFRWVGALIALFAATLSSIQTFFNFQNEYEGHRQIGNEYLTIARDCDQLIAHYFDGLIELVDFAPRLEKLNSKYIQINARSESLSVSDKDYKLAKAFQETKIKTEPSLVQIHCKDELQS